MAFSSRVTTELPNQVTNTDVANLRIVMKFAFVVNNYPPKIGGVELHVQSLASELVRQGHDALVITLAKQPSHRLDAGVEIISLKEYLRVADVLGFPALGTRRKLTKLFELHGVEIVSVHTRFFPMSFVGMRAAKKIGIPLILTEHGSDHVASDSPIIRWASRLIDFTLGRLNLRQANRVLGVSEDVITFVRRLAGVNATLFYNAIALPSENVHGPNIRSSFVFVGRMVAGKGWETFLDALKTLQMEGEHFDALLAGEGPDLNRVRSRIIELKLGGRVKALGRVSPTEVRTLLRNATLVNPTVLAEGFQTTLLESIAEGGRVLTFPVPGAQTLNNQGAPVTITQRSSAAELIALMRNALRQDWNPASSELIRQWCWPTRAAQYASIAQQVTNGN